MRERATLVDELSGMTLPELSDMFDVYIMGPMAGKKHLNLGEFKAVQNYVQNKMGLKALIPQQIPPTNHEGDCPENFKKHENSVHAECCYARSDLVWMLRNCNGCYVLPRWPASVGTRLELSVAAQTGMPIYFISRIQLTEIMYAEHRSNRNIIDLPEGLTPIASKQ